MMFEEAPEIESNDGMSNWTQADTGESKSSPKHLQAAPAVMNPCETEAAEA